MQKVWDELKKIEAQAERIQAEAQDKAKNITLLAKQESDKLMANSKAYGEEESAQLNAQAVEEANQHRQELLVANEQAAAKLKSQAKKRMDKAVSVVVSAVLEETHL
jgi:V/A-type H+/Na+-transporting ATPase subunit G/H